MILDVLWRLFDTLVGPVVRLLPKGSIADSLPSAEPLNLTINQWDNFLPIIGPLRIVSGYVLAFAIFAGVQVVIFVWRLIPGKAT